MSTHNHQHIKRRVAAAEAKGISFHPSHVLHHPIPHEESEEGMRRALAHAENLRERIAEHRANGTHTSTLASAGPISPATRQRKLEELEAQLAQVMRDIAALKGR